MKQPLSVLAALDAQLKEFEAVDRSVAASAVAASARIIASRLDDPETSATAVAACAKELREQLSLLYSLLPAKEDDDRVNELAVSARRKLRLAE